MTAALAAPPVVRTRRPKHPLPPPLLSGTRILDGQRPWELHPPCPLGEIAFVLLTNRREMLQQWSLEPLGQYGHPVAITLSSAHGDLVGRQVHVLRTELQRLKQPKSGPIQKRCDKLRRPPHPRQPLAHLVARQHDRYPRRALCADDGR